MIVLFWLVHQIAPDDILIYPGSTDSIGLMTCVSRVL